VGKSNWQFDYERKSNDYTILTSNIPHISPIYGVRSPAEKQFVAGAHACRSLALVWGEYYLPLIFL